MRFCSVDNCFQLLHLQRLHKKLCNNLCNLHIYIVELAPYYIDNEASSETEVKKMEVINRDGHEINFEAVVSLMDDELREELNRELAPCTEQEFFEAYEKAHAEKFGEEFQI